MRSSGHGVDQDPLSRRLAPGHGRRGLELSGYIAFTAFLSLFPFLIFLAALAGFLGDRETADGFIEAMFNFMPDDVAETLAPAVREVVGAREGGLLTFGILATLWFASNGFEALRTGLNRAYGVSEQRAMWWLRLQSIAFVISGGLIILFLSLVVILGPLVWKVLGPAVHSVLETRLLFGTARYLFAGVLLFGAAHLAPPLVAQHQAGVRPHPARGRGDHGAVAARGQPVRLVCRSPYRLFRVLRQPRRGRDTLMFFYISAIIFIFGAEFNAVWRERTGRRAAPEDRWGRG